MVDTCVDTVIESLLSLRDLKDWEEYRVHTLEVELRFIQMLLCCSVSCDSDAYLRSIITSIESIWQPDGTSSEFLHKFDRLYLLGKRSSYGEEIKKILSEQEEKVLLSKQEIEKHSYQSISKSLVCKPLTVHEMQQFLDAIIKNMDRLVNSGENGVILPLKNQVETLQKKLLIFRNLVEFTSVLCLLDCKVLDDFNIHVLTWANTAVVCLTFPFSDVDYRNLLVTDLLQKVNPKTPEFIDMCFALIKLTKSSSLDILFFEELVSDFVDFLLHNLMLTPEDGFDMLREGLIYLITFFAGSPATSAEDAELILIDAVLSEASQVIFMLCEAKVDFSTEKLVLAQLLNTIDQIRGKINKHCVLIPLSRWSHFPHIDGLGFHFHFQ